MMFQTQERKRRRLFESKTAVKYGLIWYSQEMLQGNKKTTRKSIFQKHSNIEI